ncbi:MAG: universal stress protein [Phycisphaerae bacterium]|jgi:nucleotide-binding universal stress UspA family protein
MTSNQDNLLGQVVVGVGGSERSFIALRYASELARAGGGKLESLIVEEPVVPLGLALARGGELQSLIERGERERHRVAGEIERNIRRTAAEHDFKVDITRSQGSVTDCIVEASDRASLLVLGKRGCREDSAGLLGSNTELIVRRTHKPVLLTPRGYRPLQGILLALGGKDAGPVVLETGKSLADALSVSIEVFTVSRDPDRLKRIQEGARAALADARHEVRYTGSVGHVAETIAGYARPDHVLVMGAYGHSRLYRMTLGSVTEQVMRAARGPVLLCAKHG